MRVAVRGTEAPAAGAMTPVAAPRRMGRRRVGGQPTGPGWHGGCDVNGGGEGTDGGARKDRENRAHTAQAGGVLWSGGRRGGGRDWPPCLRAPPRVWPPCHHPPRPRHQLQPAFKQRRPTKPPLLQYLFSMANTDWEGQRGLRLPQSQTCRDDIGCGTAAGLELARFRNRTASSA